MSALYPFLAVRDTDAAIAFYGEAFGATVRERLEAPGGTVVAVLEIAGMPFGVATEAPQLGTPSPETLGATTVRVSLHVDDPDATAAQAIAAGATEMFPVTDQPYGLRQGRVVDPFGHHWLIANDSAGG
ncbi:MAG: VOC family protein [Gaiellaceae bacterium]